MGIPALCICAILAIAPLLWLPELPSRYTVWIMLAGGGGLGTCQNVRLKDVGTALLFCAVGPSCRAGERLADAAFNHRSRTGRGRDHRH